MCFPAWECPVFWSCRAVLCLTILVDTGAVVTEMNAIADLDMIALVALVICSVAGAALYAVYSALGQFAEKKGEAEKIRIAAAEEKRELTEIEKIRIEKWSRFDIIFAVAMAASVIIGAGASIATSAVLGISKLGLAGDDVVMWGVLGFFASMVLTFLLDRIIVQTIVGGMWTVRSNALFHGVVERFDSAASTDAPKTGIENLKDMSFADVLALLSGVKRE